MMTKDEYIAIAGSEFGLKKLEMPYITIQCGIVEVHAGGKFFFKIENSKVEIL